MNTQKLIVILLVLVIVFSAIIIVMNFSTEGKTTNQSPNAIVTDPDDSSSGEIGLGVLPSGGGG